MNTTPTLEPQEVQMPAILAAQLRTHSPTAPSRLDKTMGAAFGALEAYVTSNGLRFTGPPRALYTTYGPKETQFIAAVPVAEPEQPLQGETDITIDTLPGGRALCFVHRGPYRGIRKTYEAISSWMAGAGLLESQNAWARYMPVCEEYVNDPAKTPEDELITRIYIPIAHAKV